MSTPRIRQLTDELVSCCQLRVYDKSVGGGVNPPEETNYFRFPPKLIAFAKLIPGNDHCPDCKLRSAPATSTSLTWANIGFGTLVCEECAYTHIHVHKNSSVVALDSSSWTLHQILSILEGGNREMLKALGRIRRISLTGPKEPFTFEYRYGSKEAATYQRRLSKKALDACRTFKGIGVRKQQQQNAELPAIIKSDQPSQSAMMISGSSQDARGRSRHGSHDRSTREENSNFEQIPSTSKFRLMSNAQNESKGKASQKLLQMMRKKIPLGTLPTDKKTQAQAKKNTTRTKNPPEKAPQVEDDSVSVFFERINNLEREEMQMKLEKQPPGQRGAPPSYQNKILRPTDDKLKRFRIQHRSENESNDTDFHPSQINHSEERSKESSKRREPLNKQRMNGGGPSTVTSQGGDFNRQTVERQNTLRQLRVSNVEQNAVRRGTNEDRPQAPIQGMQTSAQNSVNNERSNSLSHTSTRTNGDRHNTNVRQSRPNVVDTFGNLSIPPFHPTKHINDERQSATKQNGAPPMQGKRSNILRQEKHISVRNMNGDVIHGKREREENRQSMLVQDFDPSRHINDRRKSEAGLKRTSMLQSNRRIMLGEMEDDWTRQIIDENENKVADVKDLYEEQRPKMPKTKTGDFDPAKRAYEDIQKRHEGINRQDSLLGSKSSSKKLVNPDAMLPGNSAHDLRSKQPSRSINVETRPTADENENKVTDVKDLYEEQRPKMPKTKIGDFDPLQKRQEGMNRQDAHIGNKSSSRKVVNPDVMLPGNGFSDLRSKQPSSFRSNNSDQTIILSSNNESSKASFHPPKQQQQQWGERFRPKTNTTQQPNEFALQVESEEKSETVVMSNTSSSRKRRPSAEKSIHTIDSVDAVVRQIADSVKPYDAPPSSNKIVLELPADLATKFRHTVIHKRVSMDTCTAIVTEEPALVDMPVPEEPIFNTHSMDAPNHAFRRPSHQRHSSADTIPMSNISNNKGVGSKVSTSNRSGGGGGGSRTSSQSGSGNSRSLSLNSSRNRTSTSNIDQYKAYLDQQNAPNRGTRIVNVSKRRVQSKGAPVVVVHNSKKVAPSSSSSSSANVGFQSGPYYVQP